MEKKEAIKIIGELTKKNSEYRAEVNDQLNRIRGFVEQDYNRGAEDAWALAWKISAYKWDGGYATNELQDIFGTVSLQKVFGDFTAAEAIVKVKEWEERKKKEEEEKQYLRCGDVVKIIDKTPGASNDFEAIYLAEDNSYYSLMVKGSYNTTYLPKRHFALTKTGEHVDLSWLNGDEEEE